VNRWIWCVTSRGKMPDLPLILMSGSTSEDLVQRGLELSHGHRQAQTPEK